MSSLDENTKEFLRKIKALADQGIGGEKSNAESLLMKKLKQLGISFSDLEVLLSNKELSWHDFSFKKSKYKSDHDLSFFFKIICVQVFGKITKSKDIISYPHRKNYYSVKLSHEEYINFSIQVDLYMRAIIKDLDVFQYSFLLKNDLLLKRDESDSYIPSKEDLAFHRKAMHMSEGISFVPVNKMIE